MWAFKIQIVDHENVFSNKQTKNLDDEQVRNIEQQLPYLSDVSFWVQFFTEKFLFNFFQVFSEKLDPETYI